MELDKSPVPPVVYLRVGAVNHADNVRVRASIRSEGAVKKSDSVIQSTLKVSI